MVIYAQETIKTARVSLYVAVQRVHYKLEVSDMSKIKKDRSKSELGSPNVEGQGTTTSEQGVQSSSANKKQKRS
jgi:hypothetical protein